jgi:hypothetical protein
MIRKFEIILFKIETTKIFGEREETVRINWKRAGDSRIVGYSNQIIDTKKRVLIS